MTIRMDVHTTEDGGHCVEFTCVEDGSTVTLCQHDDPPLLFVAKYDERRWAGVVVNESGLASLGRFFVTGQVEPHGLVIGASDVG